MLLLISCTLLASPVAAKARKAASVLGGNAGLLAVTGLAWVVAAFCVGVWATGLYYSRGFPACDRMSLSVMRCPAGVLHSVTSFQPLLATLSQG